MDPAEQQLLNVIEDLAARLAIALGGIPKITSSRSHPTVNASRGGLSERGEILAGRVNNLPRRTGAAPSFSPAPVVPRHAMADGLRNNNMIFALASRPHGAGAQPAMVHRRGSGTGTGTGVFLPRNEGVCRTASWAACPLGNSNKSIRFSNRRGQQLSSISQQPW